MAQLSLMFLQRFEVTLAGAPVTRFRSMKTQALLAYLAVEAERPHPRSTLAGLLWPDEPEPVALHNLSQTLFQLRQTLCDREADPPFLLVSRQNIQFNPGSDYSLDVTTFTNHVRYYESHSHTETNCPSCIERLRQAVDLYRGPFLAEFFLNDGELFEEWMVLKREWLHWQALEVLEHLAGFYERLGEYGQAETYGRRQVALDPFREAAHRRLMRVLALSGQGSAAMIQYDICQRLLVEELGTGPSSETVALYEKIRTELWRDDETDQVELAELANPYKGLHAFEEADAANFFGRKVLVQQLLSRLAEDTEGARFLALVGPSGSGKSSVVKAGLLPALRRGTLPGSEQWRMVVMRPGVTPFETLASVLRTVLLDLSLDLLDRLRGSRHGLLRVVGEGLPDEIESELLLVIDQFEELFTLVDAAEWRRFLDSLVMAATHPSSRLRVVITMRADFYDRPLSEPGFGRLLQTRTQVILPLTSEELREVVVQPAARVGVRLEPELVGAIVQEVGESRGVLPLLEYALMELFEEREGRQLTLAAYRRIGGVLGALGQRAEVIYAELDEKMQVVARQLFLRLVTVEEGVEDARRRVRRAELEALETETGALERVLAAFGHYRLLTFDRDALTQEPTVEVAHEALISTWRRLREWLVASRADLRVQRQLHAAAAEWDRAGKDPSYLATGVRLSQFEALAAESDIALTVEERSYLDASLAWRDQERIAAEMQRQRELAQAQALATAERERAETARQASGRLRWLVTGLLVLFLFSATAVVQAVGQRQEAQHQAGVAIAAQATAVAERGRAEGNAQLALAHQLAAQAINFADSQLDLALLLNLESLQRTNSSEDRASTLSDFNYHPLVTAFLHGATEPIHGVVFNRDGSTLLGITESNRVLSWDVTTRRYRGELLHSEQQEEGAAQSQPATLTRRVLEGTVVAFSPDAQRVATAAGSTVTLWDLLSGEPIGSPLAAHVADIANLAFAQDGSMVLSGSKDGSLYLWDAVTGKILSRNLEYDGSAIINFHPEVSRVAISDTVDEQVAIRLFDLMTGEPVGEPLLGHTAELHGIIFGPDGTVLASPSFDGTIRLWNTTHGEPIGEPLTGHDGRVLTVVFSPDGKTLASGGTDNRILLWDVATGQQLGPPLTGHNNWVRGLAFSPDGNTLASSDASGQIILWDMRARQILAGHTDRVRNVALTPDGRVLLTSGFDDLVIFWDAATGERLHSIATEHDGAQILSLAVSPDGRSFATSDFNGQIIVWDLARRQPRYALIDGHDAPVLGLAFSPDGKLLASGDFAGQMNLWEVTTGERRAEPIQAHEGWAMSLAFSPNGALLASGSTDTTIRFWDVATREPLGEPLTGHTNWVTSLVFSADGEILLSASSDKTVRLWDVDGRQALGAPLVGHEAQVWSALFNPADGGRTVLSLGSDGSVIHWDLATREPLAPPLRTGKETETMAISPDGQTLYVGSFDETALLWRFDQEPWQTRACTVANRNLTLEEWREYLHEGQYREICQALP